MARKQQMLNDSSKTIGGAALLVVLLIVSAVLAFTFVVPIAGAVCIAILFVVRIICFFQVCSGKAKDAAIIGKLPFLK